MSSLVIMYAHVRPRRLGQTFVGHTILFKISYTKLMAHVFLMSKTLRALKLGED